MQAYFKAVKLHRQTILYYIVIFVFLGLTLKGTYNDLDIGSRNRGN